MFSSQDMRHIILFPGTKNAELEWGWGPKSLCQRNYVFFFCPLHGPLHRAVSFLDLATSSLRFPVITVFGHVALQIQPFVSKAVCPGLFLC